MLLVGCVMEVLELPYKEIESAEPVTEQSVETESQPITDKPINDIHFFGISIKSIMENIDTEESFVTRRYLDYRL